MEIFQPIGDRCVVRVISPPSMHGNTPHMVGGIIIPDAKHEDRTHCEIVCISQSAETEFKAGDEVYTNGKCGLRLDIDGDRCYIARVEDIMAKTTTE